MAKPDNRADNVEHLQQALNHTMENIREAGTFLAAHADDMNPKDVAALEQKMKGAARPFRAFAKKSRTKRRTSANSIKLLWKHKQPFRTRARWLFVCDIATVFNTLWQTKPHMLLACRT
ncbi:hypothetical protein GCM10025858_11430 [Alicyclobacillus sacchari]|nr:hypothetical protein GCM10025858_11430 [Alicyclobacillus sacchari]